LIGSIVRISCARSDFYFYSLYQIKNFGTLGAVQCIAHPGFKNLEH